MSVFTSLGAVASLAVTNSTGSVAVSGGGGNPRRSVRVWNSGSVTIFIKAGSSSVTAATTDRPIPAGTPPEIFAFGPGDTHIAGITASGSGTIYFEPGEGGA